jgi:MYXO-CTERM domain-containing protein
MVAAQVLASSFSKWIGTECPTATGSGRVSVDIRDLGPVACDAVTYNSNQGNQNAIIFHDDVWPHNDSANTLGLTTVTFDVTTGEIYDADMEINSTLPLSVGDASQSAYDLESVVTHEAGHFFGLAHSPDMDTTMYAFYTEGSTAKRILAADDMAGICAIYDPSGTRSVDTWTSADGGAWTSDPAVSEGACDPTPRHGFQSACSSPQKSGCAVAPGPASGAGTFFGAGAAAMALSVARRRRKGRVPSLRAASPKHQ